MSKTTAMILVQIRDPQGRDIETIIREAYAETGSLRGAGERMGIDGSTLHRWIARLGIDLDLGGPGRKPRARPREAAA